MARLSGLMHSNPENRDKTRFEHQSKVMLEKSDIGIQHGARMFNYSYLGLYFEADFRLQPETEIRIGISDSPFASKSDKYESYRGIIKWRKELKRSSYYYGYGVEFIKKAVEESDRGQYHGTRSHPRKAWTVPVKYESEKQTYEGITKDVSRGGIFIKTKNPVAVGQPIKVEIPLKKKNKIAKLTGEVIWSNRQGFGVKFLQSDKKNRVSET